jgi:hypothetical protein
MKPFFHPEDFSDIWSRSKALTKQDAAYIANTIIQPMLDALEDRLELATKFLVDNASYLTSGPINLEKEYKELLEKLK